MAKSYYKCPTESAKTAEPLAVLADRLASLEDELSNLAESIRQLAEIIDHVDNNLKPQWTQT